MGTINNHQPYKGFETTIRVAIGRVMPPSTPISVTLGAAAAAAATSLTVTALGSPIDVGNWLQFVDSNGLEYLARVAANAASAATTITVDALVEAIPNGSVAKFPSELFDRKNVDTDRKYNTKDIYTLNTGGQRTIVAVSGEKSIKAAGFYHHYNAGYRICEQEGEAKRQVWVYVEYPPPGVNFSKGQVEIFRSVITNLPKASDAEDFVQGDVEFEVTGANIPSIAPVLAP